MPTKIEKDSVTGTETTGHVWDGIRELNTPLPKWWLYVFYATIAFSLVYWVVYPSIPGVSGYTKGVLGTNNRLALEEKMAKARERQAEHLERIGALDVTGILDDADARSFAVAGGRAAFADNCAPCHGPGGAGQHGYPSLADDSWLWGGTPDEIQTTILYGIRGAHDETHFSIMPGFGRDEILEPEEIEEVADYTLSLSGAEVEASEAGSEIYADNCAACHGEQGEGDPSQGAPALNDQIWLYGGDRDQVITQIQYPRHGEMPPWVDRLDEETIKMLTVYVHALGGGQ